MREITEIIVHCLDTRPSWMSDSPIEAKRDEVTRWHVDDRGWRDIGYHELIDRDGATIIGRDLDDDGDPWEHQGAAVKGHNVGTIHLALVGGHGSSATDDFLDNFTVKQASKLRRRIQELLRQFPTITKVSGHNDYAAKACPGFKVDRWLERDPPERASITQSKTLQASAVVKGVSVAQPVISTLSGVPWQTVAVLSVFSLVALIATGVIDLERFRKWRGGDK